MKKYQIYCETESSWQISLGFSEPTVCPNDNLHQVKSDSVMLVTTTVLENKMFADNLMQRLKEKNMQEGLSSIDQSAWVHHRMRKIDFTLSDTTTVIQIDLMNLIISGDIETAEYVLGQLAPDDMTQSYHWLTQTRIDWIRNEIRAYLGWPQI